MGRKDRQIVGLDLGSSKTRALLCQRNQEGKLEVAGFGEAESKGWRKGVIAKLDAAVLAIKKAVEKAEEAGGIPADAAFVGVAGIHIKGVNARGAITLGKSAGATREVTRQDKLDVFHRAKSIALLPDRLLLNVLAQEYVLDSQNGIRDPLGMVGNRLEVGVHIITASLTAHENVVTAVGRTGIEVLETVFEPLAAAWACLTEDERELGVALVDMGAGSADLIVYHQGHVRHSAVIAVGGDHFTNDIAVGLRTPIPEAEKMKLAWGDRDPARPAGEVVEVPSVGERPARVVSYAMLSDIIEPRATELVELMQAELERAGFAKQLGAGVVLCGGGASLGGLVSLAEQMLGLPVRIGRPSGLLKMSQDLADPSCATVVGLVVHANRLHYLRDARESGWAGKLWNSLWGRGG